MVACHTIYDYKYPDYFCVPFRKLHVSKEHIGIFANHRAKFVPYSRDVVVSQKTSCDNKHNSMSTTYASLINYSSWVIEAFANSTSSFIRRGWRRALLCETGASYSRRLCSRERLRIYIYIYTYARQLRDCIIAKSLIERQVSNAAESWEGTAASVHPIFSGHQENPARETH